MSPLLADLGVSLPVLAAPMAGGPSTPELVVAAAGAGSMGFLAGGYKSPDALAAEIAAVAARGVPFGVNLFAPHPVPVDPDAFRRYARALQPEAARFGLDLAVAAPVEDDDSWAAKLEVLAARPVPVVSFTFAIPSAAEVSALRRAGTVVLQTVTTGAEARRAAEAGVDGLVVQGGAAGGHSGTLTPDHPAVPVALPDLVAEVVRTVGLPVLAAGGLATPEAVAAVLDAGAEAVAVGTLLLRARESGASATYQAAVAAAAAARTGPGGPTTVVTRAFTGRPARGLRNGFIERFDAVAPLGYPAIHHLTLPLRRAAAAAGDPDGINLWAGTGFRHVVAAPTAAILAGLAGS